MLCAAAPCVKTSRNSPETISLIGQDMLAGLNLGVMKSKPVMLLGKPAIEHCRVADRPVCTSSLADS
jgi:hypothetical protein